jgi:hypothetical protein
MAHRRRRQLRRRRPDHKEGGRDGKGVWELFREETGSTMSITRLGMEMTRLVADPMVPFDQKVRPMRGAFYPVKARGS